MFYFLSNVEVSNMMNNCLCMIQKAERNEINDKTTCNTPAKSKVSE